MFSQPRRPEAPKHPHQGAEEVQHQQVYCMQPRHNQLMMKRREGWPTGGGRLLYFAAPIVLNQGDHQGWGITSSHVVLHVSSQMWVGERAIIITTSSPLPSHHTTIFAKPFHSNWQHPIPHHTPQTTLHWAFFTLQGGTSSRLHTSSQRPSEPEPVDKYHPTNSPESSPPTHHREPRPSPQPSFSRSWVEPSSI